MRFVTMAFACILFAALGVEAAQAQDGSIVAFGRNVEGQCDVPAPNVGFVAVAAGWAYSLGLKSDGSIVAWGDNSYDRAVPTPNSEFVAVAAGELFSLGLRGCGSIAAWG